MAAAYWSRPHCIEPQPEVVKDAPGGMLLSAGVACLVAFLSVSSLVDELDKESFPIGSCYTIQRIEGRVLVQPIFQSADR